MRGELEITDLIRAYLDNSRLRVELLGRRIAWLDAGTAEALLRAANFLQGVEERQGMMISCPEEIAWRMGYITREQLHELARTNSQGHYIRYLQKLLQSLDT